MRQLLLIVAHFLGDIFDGNMEDVNIRISAANAEIEAFADP